MTPVAYALYRIGNDALPRRLETVRLEDQRMFKEDGRPMWPGDDIRGIISEIGWAINSPDLNVRRESY